ncbi:MAG: T9SS type A sorting domain-containing protein [Bacteroidales bacterium]|nr:T9SS type A sorting domain-containing protein [Bacteroidales bacterium]MCF8456014.1 T9SS type A sorting domain-containing protein [Bacteroidales bacterium]
MKISAFPIGVYILRLQTDNGFVMKKLVKQ